MSTKDIIIVCFYELVAILSLIYGIIEDNNFYVAFCIVLSLGVSIYALISKNSKHE